MTDLPTSLLDAREAIEKAIIAARETFDDRIKHEHGIPASGETRVTAGHACVQLCAGDADRARTLWKLIVEELGYMPLAAAVALIRASKTENLTPDIPEPDLDAVPR
jgi:hypothetical protein